MIKKTKPIMLRMTEKDHKLFAKMAKANNMLFATYARKILVEYLEKNKEEK